MSNKIILGLTLMFITGIFLSIYFQGCFVLEHHTLPGIRSHLTAPDGLNVKFNLQILWSEQTFDGPTQIWKATSNYNLKVDILAC